MASKPRKVQVSAETPTLIWRTVTGQGGATTTQPSIDVTGGIYRAGSAQQPLYIVVTNNGTDTVYLGTGDVDTTGLPLYAKSSLSWSISGNDAIYGLSATGTGDVRVLAGAAIK